MGNVLNWSRFDTGLVGPDDAFAAFVAQLFERWLRREVGQDFVAYVLHGAGGDGGVEAFATLQTGEVIGLQAKWFPGNLNDSRVRQIRQSIDTAGARHIGLRRYIVAMPCNLTTATRAKGKAKRGGVERWDDLVAATKIARPALELIRWDEAVLLGQLACPGNQELKALWFEGELTLGTLETAWKRTESRLGHRYMPALHAVSEIDQTLQRDLWSAAHVEGAKATFDDATQRLAVANDALAGFTASVPGKLADSLHVLVREVNQTISALRMHVSSLRKCLATGPGRLPPASPDLEAIAALSSELQDFKDTPEGTYTARYAEHAIGAVRSATRQLVPIDEWLRSSARPRLFVGPAGCGKTHASAATVASLTQAGTPALMMLAREHNPASGAASVLREALDLPGWPLRRILDALEALVILKQVRDTATTDRTTGFSRGVLLIDGLEEATNAARWTEALSDLTVELAARPRLHLVATTRPEYVAQVTLPAGLSTADLDEDGDVNLPILFRTYVTHFKVTVDDVPWLGWAIRTPLEIRLFAEEFAGRSIAASTGANTNLLTLFRRKIDRLEEEARRRSDTNPWSPNLGLVSHILTALSQAASESNTPRVAEVDLVRRVMHAEPEFTAQYIRSVLSLLQEYGLVDRWVSPVLKLEPPQPQCGLATRHLSDYVLASDLAEHTLAALTRGTKVPFPSMLHGRTAAAVLFMACLAEKQRFAIDIPWTSAPAPDTLRLLYAESLALLVPDIAGSRRSEIEAWLTESTALNRGLLGRLTLRVARIPSHPLGPVLLDSALRKMPLAQRDSIWSVPEDLPGTGPWSACFNAALDGYELSGDVDHWEGLPLVSAWSCSSVVEKRRRRAREALAVWGAQRLQEMALLLEHMASVDDPQIVDDVAMAALGAAIGAPVDDPALEVLAHVVDRLFFAANASAWTTSVPARVAARGIIERAALVHPNKFAATLARARPPYDARGDWPPVDSAEASAHSHFGGALVRGDLDWYVADHCFDEFAKPASFASPAQDRQMEPQLLQAIGRGELAAPATLAKRRQDAMEANEAARRAAQDARDTLMDELRAMYCERTGDSSPPSSDTALLEWMREQPEFKDGMSAGGSVASEQSADFIDFLARLRETTGLDSSAKAFRNGMLAHLVKSWGWSAAGFSCPDRNAPPTLVDDAIERQHGTGSSQGSRSPVATFREKYVWAAVDRVAGALADRLPVWSSDAAAWIRLKNLDGVGNPLPDPLPATTRGDGRAYARTGVWTPEEILPELFAEEKNLARRAERWISESPLPDPRSFLGGGFEGWDNAAILAFVHHRRGHQYCVDQLVQVRAFAVPHADLDYLRRDHRYVLDDLYENQAWVEEGVYASPALACWAPWLTWKGQNHGYNSFDEHGDVRPVSITALVGAVTARVDGEWPTEPEVWMPAPHLRSALDVTGMTGDRWFRSYVNGKGVPVAVERDLPSKSVYFDHHYLATDGHALRTLLTHTGCVPVWGVRVFRDVTAALVMHGHSFKPSSGLTHRSRETVWLVIGTDHPDAFEVIIQTDRLTPLPDSVSSLSGSPRPSDEPDGDEEAL